DADLAGINAAADIRELAIELGELDRAGVGGVAGYFVAKDAEGDAERAYLVQSGLGLPDEAYYRQEQHQETLAAYREYVTDMLELYLAEERALPGSHAGEGAAEAAEAILRFETQLAEGHWDNVTSRDADKTHNPMAVADLPTGFPFEEWFEATGVTAGSAAAERVIVSQPSFIEHVGKLAGSVPLDDWKLWATWRALNSRAPHLPAKFTARRCEFHGRTLSGSTEQRARWKRGLGLVERAIGEEVGKKFVAEHFPPEYKEKMLELVDYLIEAYRERISTLEWMTPAKIGRASCREREYITVSTVGRQADKTEVR